MEAMLAQLAEMPELECQEVLREANLEEGQQADAMVKVRALGQPPAWLRVEVVPRGYPRDIRETALRLAEDRDRGRVPLVAAPSLSPGSRRLLRKLEVGYWDAGGSLYLRLPRAVLLVDRPAPRVRERRGLQVFRGASSQVLHVLLMERDRDWKGVDLARRAGVSPATVHRVALFLEEQLWGEREGRGPRSTLRLYRPGDLLDAWARHHSLRLYTIHRYYGRASSEEALEGKALEFLEYLGKAGVRTALTLEAGALRVAPHVTSFSQVAALVHPGFDPRTAVGQGEFVPAPEHGNLLLLEPSSQAPLMFVQEVDGVPVASPVQLYLDLSVWPRRGKEQAAHLRRERLGF